MYCGKKTKHNLHMIPVRLCTITRGWVKSKFPIHSWLRIMWFISKARYIVILLSYDIVITTVTVPTSYESGILSFFSSSCLIWNMHVRTEHRTNFFGKLDKCVWLSKKLKRIKFVRLEQHWWNVIKYPKPTGADFSGKVAFSHQ